MHTAQTSNTEGMQPRSASMSARRPAARFIARRGLNARMARSALSDATLEPPPVHVSVGAPVVRP